MKVVKMYFLSFKIDSVYEQNMQNLLLIKRVISILFNLILTLKWNVNARNLYGTFENYNDKSVLYLINSLTHFTIILHSVYLISYHIIIVQNI